MLSLPAVIYACITAFLTFFVLRLLALPRLPAVVAALTSPYWFGSVAGLLSEISWQWLIGLGLLIPYVFGPVLVRALARWPAYPEFEPYNRRDEPLPAGLGTFFDDVERSLAPEGYSPEVWLVQRGFVQHTTSRMRLFVNEREQSAAIAYAIDSDDPLARQFVTYIDFISYRRDGRHRITNNAPRPSPYPAIWSRELEAFPQVRDPARLARLHRALVRRDGLPAPLPDEIRQDPLSYAADVVRRELEHQMATGYLAHEVMEDHIRPTWRGAALMTWKMLPPASWLLAWRIRRRADESLAILNDVGDDEQPLSTPADESAGSPSLIPLTSVAAVLVAVAIFRLPELFGGVTAQTSALPGAPSEEIALLSADQELELFRRVGTSDAPDGRSPDAVVAWLRALRADYPLSLTGAGTHWIDARLTDAPADPLPLARRLREFCSDRAPGTIEDLAKEIARTRQIRCRW